MALTRDAVVDTAVRLLAESGLEGLTLRRLGRELGVSAPTLYWHVADKRTLLDHVAERLLAGQWADAPAGGGDAWRCWLRERSLAQYRVLVAHRDAALVVAGNRPTPDGLDDFESVLATLVAAGFEPVDAFRSLMDVGHYVIGSAVEYHAEVARPRSEPIPPDAGRRPWLATVGPAVEAEGPETQFLHGLDLILDGMRARLAATPTPPATTPPAQTAPATTPLTAPPTAPSPAVP